MPIKNISLVALTTVCLGLVGCGGGSDSNDELDNQTNTEADITNDVLTGIFVDSAVGGASYSTSTQSGTTSSAGEFNYIDGEQVTFSIGATMLPIVDAAPEVSPVDMGVGSSTPANTTTNIARLLQSLDTDGNPDNGITISADAALNAAFINFDVSTDEFSNNTDVINLVANSGSINTTLISADAANAHLNETLNLTSETENMDSNNVTLSTLSGFYDSTVNGIRQFYLLINADGSTIEYEASSDGSCFKTETWSFTSLGDNLFRLERPDREAEEFRVEIQNGDLVLNGDFEAGSVVLPLVTSLSPSDIAVCN